MEKKDYYQILELTDADKSLSPDEFAKVIKANYRRLCKEKHPDKNQSDPDAEAKFKDITVAYETISNPNKRREYDNSSVGGSNNSWGNVVMVGESVKLYINLTLEEVFSGVSKQDTYTRKIACTTCDGAGGTGTPVQCNVCNGSGLVYKTISTPIGFIRQMIECNACGGDGKNYPNTCGTCHGHGTLPFKETVNFDIPSGVHSGMMFIMKEKGNAIRNGIAGDLNVIINVQNHKTFVRNGNDLSMTLNLSYPQLVLGDKVVISTIEGGSIRVDIPEYSNLDSLLKVTGKGLKAFKENKRGDLYINLDIEIPKHIDDETKAMLEKMKNSV